jgi:phosphoribosyl 1,2-cyclic phosphate phosphodiesterase
MLVADAIDFARSIGAQRTYLTHLTHEIGFHDEANSKLPPDVRFAYDGLTIEV